MGIWDWVFAVSMFLCFFGIVAKIVINEMS